MSHDDDIELRIVQEEDREAILEVLRKFFFKDEPLTGFTEPMGVASVTEEEYVLNQIKYGTSVMAIHKPTNKVVGACMAGPQGVDEADHLFEESAKEGDTKWGKILKMLACIERDAKVSQRYGVEKILYIIGTCVDSSMRGKNLGSRLYNAVRDLGKQKGYQLLRADCTSFYSAQIKERLGWDCINTIVYKEFVDDNNKPYFSPPAPHDACRSYALRL
ncbi:arylalkylamine N-acetyltransferase-like 2 [Musca vetustissima]|uniref:arylalkylamine N-acetyltransferase-like 2 n=1 Tax=Musca vetustissima TaxID=27455 RepID=UPI002AB6FF14|nr:arylalkylamine N-acetyltransferase-like 2 [Musca vetustissima]